MDSCPIEFETGHEFMSNFDRNQQWNKPYLIRRALGLNLRMPDDDFSAEKCIDMMGLFALSLFYKYDL